MESDQSETFKSDHSSSQKSSLVYHVELTPSQLILSLISLLTVDSWSVNLKNRVRLLGSTPQQEIRQALILPLPNSKNNFEKKSLIYECEQMFNHLPTELE